jgi:hypothetical protein
MDASILHPLRDDVWPFGIWIPSFSGTALDSLPLSNSEMREEEEERRKTIAVVGRRRAGRAVLCWIRFRSCAWSSWTPPSNGTTFRRSSTQIACLTRLPFVCPEAPGEWCRKTSLHVRSYTISFVNSAHFNNTKEYSGEQRKKKSS